MDEQRAEFEAWAHKTHYNLGVGPNGLYQSGKTSSAWASWQAATQRQQERIAYVEKIADDAIELGNQQAKRIAEIESSLELSHEALKQSHNHMMFAEACGVVTVFDSRSVRDCIEAIEKACAAIAQQKGGV